MRYQYFLRTLALFYGKKEKKEIKSKLGLESKFLVKRLFNSLNEGAELEAFLLTTTGASNCRPFSEITFAFQRRRMQLVSDSLSYAEASLCRIEIGEREKMKSRGDRWEGIFLFPSSTARSEVFIYCFFVEIPNGSLLGGESRRGHIPMKK